MIGKFFYQITNLHVGQTQTELHILKVDVCIGSFSQISHIAIDIEFSQTS